MKQNFVIRTILTLVMLVMSLSVWADDIVTWNGIRYYLLGNTHTAQVAGIDKDIVRGEVELDSSISYNGKQYTLTEIGAQAFISSDVEKVKLPSTVTTIGERAFEDCKILKSIDLGGSVKTIGRRAFCYCEELTSVTGTESVEYIDGDNSGEAFYDVPWIDNQPDGVVYIGKVLYKYHGFMSSLTSLSIKIKEGTTQIASRAFKNNTNLVSITIPNSVTSVGYQAFHSCINLENISIPPSVTEIGIGAFHQTKWVNNQKKENGGLVYINNMLYTSSQYTRSFVIKDGTTAILDQALFGDDIESVIIPNTVKKIGLKAFFGCKKLRNIKIPSGVTSLGYGVFGESGLESISLPNTLTELPVRAFKDCYRLQNIEIPSSVTSLGYYVFDGSGLTSITIPNSITIIPRGAFYACTSLKTVKLPQSIKYIDADAFKNCNSLEEVTCLSLTVPETNENFAYSDVKNATLYVPASALEAYKSAKYWRNFGTIKAVEAKEDAVPPTIKNKGIIPMTVRYNSVELYWSKATDNYTPQEDLMYHVYRDGKEIFTFKNLTSYIATDLEPSTTYTFSVQVTDYLGNTAYYTPVQVTTNSKPAAAEKYPLFIEGQQVTSDNANDFWGDGGSIKYAPATKTLTLNWAELFNQGTEEALWLDDDITINLIGQNKISGSVYVNTTRTITIKADERYGVNASLDITGALYATCGLIIEGGCAVNILRPSSGKAGLMLGNSLLQVDKSTLTVLGDGKSPSIMGVHVLGLIGCELDVRHRYDETGYVFLDDLNREAMDKIIIEPVIKKEPQLKDDGVYYNNSTSTPYIYWVPATDDTTPGEELVYTIMTKPEGDERYWIEDEIKDVTNEVHFYDLENLLPGHTYYVMIKVTDREGNTTWYKEIKFTTKPLDTAPVLSNSVIRATNVTDKSITVEWTKATDDYTADEDIAYEVIYSHDSTFSPNFAMVVTGKNRAVIRNLMPYTTYYVKVRAIDEESNSTEYQTLVVATSSQQKGDVNCDGEVTVTDAVLIIQSLLDNNTSQLDKTVSDMDNSGEIDIRDADIIIEKILGR